MAGPLGIFDYEERGLLFRLDIRSAAYVVRPDGKAAALRLKERGLVTVSDGSGGDEGMLIVRRAPGATWNVGGAA